MKFMTYLILSLGLASVSLAQAQTKMVPYAVVAVLPDQAFMSADQAAFMNNFKHTSFKTLPTFTGQFLNIVNNKNAKSMLTQSLVSITHDALKLYQLEKISAATLPEEAVYFSIYIAPWDMAKSKKLDYDVAFLGKKPWEVEQPKVNYIEYDFNKMFHNEKAEFYRDLSKTVQTLSLTKMNSFKLQSVAIHLKLSKKESLVKIQVLSRLTPQNLPFEKVNDQVSIKTLSMTEPYTLMELNQTIFTQQKQIEIPDIQVEFGELDPVVAQNEKWPGLFKINKQEWKDSYCKRRAALSPTLSGNLGKKASSGSMLSGVINMFAKDKAVKFHIFDFKINANKAKISNMNIISNISLNSMTSCLKLKDVNEQFQNEANAAIEDKIESLYKQDDMTDELMGALYN